MAASIIVQLQIFKRPQLPCFSTDLDETGIKMHGLLRSSILNIVVIRVAVPFKRQQGLEREERLAQREYEREKREAEQKDKVREQKDKEREQKEKDREQKDKDRELEKLRIEAEKLKIEAVGNNKEMEMEKEVALKKLRPKWN